MPEDSLSEKITASKECGNFPDEKSVPTSIWFSRLPDNATPQGTQEVITRILLFCLLLLFFAPFIVRPDVFSGDEPHYLLLANSLRWDGDLELSEDYLEVAAGSDRAGAFFPGVDLDHHTVLVDTTTWPPKTVGPWTNARASNVDSESTPLSERTVRAIGWPVLIATAASLVPFAPTEIVAKILAHLCVLGAAVLIGLSLKNSGASDGVAFVGGLAIALGSSFWVYANTAFAEPLAGLCIAGAVYSGSSRKFPWLLAVALAVALWTKFQLYPAVAVLWLAAIRQFGIRRMIWPTAFCALAFFCLLAFNYSQYGAIRPPMEWVSGSPGKALVYYLSDSHGSVFSRNPWLILAVAAAVLSLIQNFARPSLWWWLLTASLFLPTIFWAEFEGGFGYPGRLVMLAFLPAALLFAPLIESRSLAVRAAAFCLFGLSVLTNLAAALSSPLATWRTPQ